MREFWAQLVRAINPAGITERPQRRWRARTDAEAIAADWDAVAADFPRVPKSHDLGTGDNRGA